GKAHRDRAIDAIWARLAAMPRWDMLELRDIADGSPIRRLADLAERENWPVGHWESLRSPYVTLPPPGTMVENQHLGTPDSTFRANLRRRLRRLESKGRLTMRVVEHADPDTLRAFFTLEASGWKGQAGSAIECDPATRRFYDEIARAGARL